jgi:hypothetical protein
MILKEENFVHEKNAKCRLPWIWILLSVAGLMCMWKSGDWFALQIDQKVNENPFLQVTNRQMSLFLWQNPEKMRAHIKTKIGYLPGFQAAPKLTPKPGHAEDYVAAPPEVLFLYHTWNHLISSYVFPKPIPLNEFFEFLNYDEEWLPDYWKEASLEYQKLIINLESRPIENLQELSELVLPKVVRQAFWGWKNYVKEGEAINSIKPTVRGMRHFLDLYPNYSRSYWCNLFPNYLASFSQEKLQEDDVISDKDLVPFLRVAYYNYMESKS